MKKKIDNHICGDCPNCGHWREKESEKNKLIEIILIIIAIILIVGYYKVYNF